MYTYPTAFFQTQPTVVAEVLVNLQRKKKGFALSSLLKGVWTVIIIHSFKAGGATVPPAQIGFQAFVGIQNMHILISTVK